MFFNLYRNTHISSLISYSWLQFLTKQSFCSSAAKTTTTGKNFGSYNIIKPEFHTPQLEIAMESGIVMPSYHFNGEPLTPPLTPEIKTESQIRLMHESCKLARFVLDCIAEHIKENMTTNDIDVFAHELIINNGAYPSPLNYRGFPKSICTSVNNIACHGIPDGRPLASGDIVNVDVTVFLNGYHGDCSATFCIGEVDAPGKSLVETTQKALSAAISIVKPGEYFSTIGSIIENIAKQNNMRVVPSILGHGIGAHFHEPPDIFHTKNDYPGKMEPGMTFTIEPVLTHGNGDVVMLEDGWTIVTEDDSRTAQFEHTVLVTDEGYKVLTY
uniref:Methionine aminopeptidase n=1 Tax=Cacopsylla melanoneura TaxID=428564 RepID=A0A8D9AWA8_9HEMI